MPRRTVLVTGATGFIGSRLIKLLTPQYHVRIFSRKHINISGAETIVGDLTQQKDVERAVLGVDCIVHLAALIKGNELLIRTFNITSTELLVAAAKKQHIKHFIFMSSENVLWPHQGSYGQSKIICEQIVQKIQHHLILRCSVVYGQENTINLGKVIDLVKKRRFILIPGNGKYFMQPIYVEDVAHFIKKGIDRKIEGTYTLAGFSKINLDDFIDLVAHFLRKKIIKIHVPLWILYPFVKIHELFPHISITWTHLKNLNTTRVYNIRTTMRDFKYTPRPIEECLASFLSKNRFFTDKYKKNEPSILKNAKN